MPGPEIYAAASNSVALRQGEILSNLPQIRLVLETIRGESQSIQEVVHPLAIVVTQDCDLDLDFRARTVEVNEAKQMPSILFCELQEATFARDHAGNSSVWGRIKINADERYHFFEEVPAGCDLIAQGLSEMCVDFKRYFTLPAAEVYSRFQINTKRRCRLRSPYLEHFATRFSHYQCRVALPAPHQSLPGEQSAAAPAPVPPRA